MTMLIRTLAAVAAGAVLATSAFAQSASEVRGPSPFVSIDNEPAPKLIVDPRFPIRFAAEVGHHATFEGRDRRPQSGGQARRARDQWADLRPRHHQHR